MKFESYKIWGFYLIKGIHKIVNVSLGTEVNFGDSNVGKLIEYRDKIISSLSQTGLILRSVTYKLVKPC